MTQFKARVRPVVDIAASLSTNAGPRALTLAPRPSQLVHGAKLGTAHHNIATDGSLTLVVLDPRLPRVGHHRPAPAGKAGTAPGWGSSPLHFPRPDHRRAVRVLHLDPVPRRPRPIWRAHSLGAIPSRPSLQACRKIRAPSSSCARSARCRYVACPPASPAASFGRPGAARAGPHHRAPTSRRRTASPL
jgi:hypothetical protein